jgi:uncharacterized protein (DUF486 family)
MIQGIYTVLLLIIANVFMTFAWYGHLELKRFDWFNSLNLFYIIMISWSIAFFEYIFQVPANRIGFSDNGGPFNLVELKIIQEFISLTVFAILAITVFKTDKFAWNHIVGFFFMLLAVFFVFKKW